MFNVKYRLSFTDEYDRQVRVDIEQDGYEGETISERVGEGFSPLHISIQNQGDPKFETIKATEIELSIFSDNFELEEISEASDKEFLMKVYEAPTEDGELSLKHIGYVIPEIYTEPYVVEPYPVTIRAASIGILNNIRYVTDEYGEFFTGEATLMTVLTRCLNKLDYQLDIWDSINTFEDRILYFDTSPLEEIKIDQAAFLFEENDREKAKTCMEVIEQILKPFVVNFFMDYGRWVIIPMELRGTNREVRIFDYQGTSQSTEIYNPLNENYDWIDQDQILEFLPVARDVDSVHEHGEPQNIVRNYQFEDDFISVSKATGEIRYPSEWVLNDSDDFLTQADSSGDIYAGIKETAVDKGGESKETRTLRFLIFRFDLPNKQNLSELKRSTTAVFMLSALINDGAYIEQTGTKIIQAGEDRVRFSIDYSGAVYVESGDINFADLKVPDNTIDHKFQVQLGSKYLDSDGSWTDTETDIILTDLGDGNPGYSDIGLSGVATRLRTFDIISDPIEESGTPVFRIYKPVSENEESGVLPTYAAVAYSTFSVELYPGGLPPDGETLYFTERDVETYSDDFEYTLESGDGPTNFHVSSFLIDTEYGNNLKTENWVRGNLEGGISEIAINAIFLEYDTKSNLIRGTQKVKGLFDRWFIEYSKGYTVLAGTYDQRLCRFNGEMVQILNAEVDVWGDELEPGPNFAVEVDPGTPNFTNDRFWTLQRYFVDSADINIVTGLFDFTTGNVNSFTEKLLIEDLGKTLYTASKNDWHPMLLNDGTAIYVGVGENGINLFKFDTGLNLIAEYDLSEPIDNIINVSSQNKVARDEFDNIYVVGITEEEDVVGGGDRPNGYIWKFDKDLNLVWKSGKLLGINSLQMVVHKNQIVVIHSYLASSNPSAPGGSTFWDIPRITSINKDDGEIHSQSQVQNDLDPNEARFDINCGGCIVDDGKCLFFVGSFADATRNRVILVTEFGVIDDNITVDVISNRGVLRFDYLFTANQTVLQWAREGVVYVDAIDQFIVYDYVNKAILSADNVSTDTGGDAMSKLDNGYWLISRYDNTGSSDNLVIDPEPYSVISDSLSIFSTAQGNFERKYKMPIDNWQLMELGGGVPPGTPTITNVVLTADPETSTVPFNSLITFGADNTGDADVTLLLTIDGVEESSITIPAGGSESFAISEGFQNPGSYLVEFAGESLTITANGDGVTGTHEGWIDIDSAATDDTDGVKPSGTIDVINKPSQQSDPCGTGGDEFNVNWKTTDYCFILVNEPDKVTIAQSVSQAIDDNVTGVTGLGSSYEGISPSGFPRIKVFSETSGVADNNEGVIFDVDSALEQSGSVFSTLEVTLSGGVDEYILSEQIDILIGGSVFATTSAITENETADSIAQKIFDACDAVGSGTYTFAKNGTRVLVGSTAGVETLDLDIKNAGFSYSTQDMEAV